MERPSAVDSDAPGEAPCGSHAERVAWRNAVSGNVVEVAAGDGGYGEELLHVACKLHVPQALCALGPGDREFVLRTQFPGMPGDFRERPHLGGRHCMMCDDLLVHPSPIPDGMCFLCGRDVCPSCTAVVSHGPTGRLYDPPCTTSACLLCWMPWHVGEDGMAYVDESNAESLRDPAWAAGVLSLRQSLLAPTDGRAGRPPRPLRSLLAFPYNFLSGDLDGMVADQSRPGGN